MTVRLAALMLLFASASASQVLHIDRLYWCFFGAGSAEPVLRCNDIIRGFAAEWQRTATLGEQAPRSGTSLPPREMQVEVHGHDG